MAVIQVKTDNWDDLKVKGPEGNVNDIGAISGYGEIISENVGKDDELDYMAFTLDDAAKLSFNISADDAAKFTIYSLNSKTNKKGVTTYSLKSLQSSTLKKQKNGTYLIDTKDLLLQQGTYYIGVQSTNAKKGGDADYTVSLNESSKFFTQGDNSDDWTNVKIAGSNACAEICRLGEINRMTNTITIGSGDKANWVGFSDAVDYAEFSLESGAKLSFNISADDAAKFTIYSLNSKKNKKGEFTYSLKSLQSSTLKKQKNGTYLIDTKDLLLQQGTYYIGVQSTNAKKGGDADYTVSLNESSKFFPQGNNSDDWTDIKTQGTAGAVGDIGTIYETGEVVSNWVGFGDDVDYMAFTLDDAAKLSFNISADDAAKFTIYSLNSKTDKKGVTTYSLKSLQSSTLKKQKDGTYLIDTKDLLLQQGTYYIGVQSTNAKKGGDADYTVSLNESSKFFTQGDNSDNSAWDANPLGELYFMDEPMIVGEGYVGLDDTVDFYSFTAEQYGSVMFSISASDAVKFTVYEMVNGKLVTMSSTTVKANSSATSKKITLKADGEYYFSVTSTNAAKGGYADYTVYGCEFAKPLKLTVGGVSEDSFWNYNDLPAAAKVGEIRGSAGDDTITFAANKYRYFGRIDLGLGNDKLIFKNSSDDAYTEWKWDSDDATGVINMGDGNNSIEIGKENFLSATEIIFGSGNDTVMLSDGDGNIDATLDFGGGNDYMKIRDSEIDCSNVLFGEGNDRLVAENDGEIRCETLDFGGGNDTLVVDKDSEINLFGGDLDFGDGNDTFVFNGTLFLEGSARLLNVENVSGNGCVIFSQYNDYNADTFELLKAAGIEVINGAGESYWYFSTPQKELADNTRAKAQVLKDEDDDGEIWLCSEQKANSLPYGFADEVDYFKIIKTSEFDEVYGSIDIEGEAKGFQIELLNSSGKHLADVELGEWGDFSLSNLKNGTYYLKFSVSGDCRANGYIEVAD